MGVKKLIPLGFHTEMLWGWYHDLETRSYRNLRAMWTLNEQRDMHVIYPALGPMLSNKELGRKRGWYSLEACDHATSLLSRLSLRVSIQLHHNGLREVWWRTKGPASRKACKANTD